MKRQYSRVQNKY